MVAEIGARVSHGLYVGIQDMSHLGRRRSARAWMGRENVRTHMANMDVASAAEEEAEVFRGQRRGMDGRKQAVHGMQGHSPGIVGTP